MSLPMIGVDKNKGHFDEVPVLDSSERQHLIKSNKQMEEIKEE